MLRSFRKRVMLVVTIAIGVVLYNIYDSLVLDTVTVVKRLIADEVKFTLVTYPRNLQTAPKDNDLRQNCSGK